MDVEGDQCAFTISECVDILSKEKAVRKKPPALSDGSSVLDILKEKAGQKGLTEDQVTQLVQVATSKKYTDAVVNQIIKCIIPRDGVSSACVVALISKMCANAVSISLQVSLLKWLILVYEWVDDKETVHCLYGMIFLFLDNDALCPFICHLLYSMTRKEDVLPFRLRKLLDLSIKVGQQPHLIGLLSLYKVHAPHLVSVNIPKIKKAFFKAKDAKWLDIVWNIKSSRAVKSKETSSTLDKDAIINFPAAKRRRKDVIIPLPHAFPQASGDGKQNKRISFQQIATFNDFLTHIDKLEFPSQMGCVLKSRPLQHLLVITRNEAAVMRLNFWLQQALYEELVSAPSGVTRERVTKFLEALLNFVSFYRKPLSSLESCMAQYLLTWNGVDYQALIFLLVSHLQIRPFRKLNDLVLEPIRRLFFCSSVQFKCQVLSCCTEMLLNLATSTLTFPKGDKRSRSTSASPLSVNDLPNADCNELRETCLIIKGLIGFVDRICIVALQIESDHILLQHCILSFFEQVSILHQHYPIRFVHIPSLAIVYRLLFATNAMPVSRLCNLIVNYKDAFECLKRAQLSGTDGPGEVLDGFERLDVFNQYILDISNTIWRNKAFEDRTKSLCYSIPRPITDALEIPHINERFSIVNHVAFVYMAKKFLTQTQAEGMKVNPSLIKGKTRTVYLEYLQRNNFDGIIRFLNTFIKPKGA